MRLVRFGRKPLAGPLAFHWAIKVNGYKNGDTWFEVAGKSADTFTMQEGMVNSIWRSSGRFADSGAGKSGGIETVGYTIMTDEDIDDFIEGWLEDNPKYCLMKANCQKFAYEFMVWLTQGEFVFNHSFNAAKCDAEADDSDEYFGYAFADNGSFSAGVQGQESRSSSGVHSVASRGAKFGVQAAAKRGAVGVFTETSVCRHEYSNNLASVHFEPNINTGAGLRNGNLEAHLLGLGGKIGSDGLELNTPIGGVKTSCAIM